MSSSTPGTKDFSVDSAQGAGMAAMSSSRLLRRGECCVNLKVLFAVLSPALMAAIVVAATVVEVDAGSGV